MRRLLLYICIILSPCVCFAEDIYISQTLQGGDSGVSCANSHSISWFNTSGNWGNPKVSGKIGPGDTAHLCGTMSTNLIVQASGSNGSPITILFEKGAKFSAPTWTGTAITINTKNYITLDGGTNGIIEATDNGTLSIWGGPKTYNTNLWGVYVNAADNVIVKNLTIKNLYDRLDNSADCVTGRGYGIYVLSSTNVTLDHNTMDRLSRGVQSGPNSQFTIKNNTISSADVGINMGVGTTATDVSVYNNTITGSAAWSGSFDAQTCLNYQAQGCSSDCVTNFFNHVDGMHFFTGYNGTGTISNLKIYNNFVQDVGPGTAHIYVEYAGLNGAKIYNNILIDTGIRMPVNGMITVKAADEVKIYNNAIIGAGSSVANRAIYLNSQNYNGIDYPLNIDIKNNIISGVKWAVGIQPGSTLTADYNDYYNNDATPFSNIAGTASINFTNWQADGHDAHGMNINPQLGVNYKFTLSSPTNIKSGGVNLSSIFNTDKDGVVRPGVAGWSLGAYQDNWWPSPPMYLQIQ